MPFQYRGISAWAGIAIERLRELNLVFGRGYFYPQINVSRAEALVMLNRVASAVYDSIHPLPLPHPTNATNGN